MATMLNIKQIGCGKHEVHASNDTIHFQLNKIEKTFKMRRAITGDYLFEAMANQDLPQPLTCMKTDSIQMTARSNKREIIHTHKKASNRMQSNILLFLPRIHQL